MWLRQGYDPKGTGGGAHLSDKTQRFCPEKPRKTGKPWDFWRKIERNWDWIGKDRDWRNTWDLLGETLDSSIEKRIIGWKNGFRSNQECQCIRYTGKIVFWNGNMWSTIYIYILYIYIYIGYPIFRETAFMIHQNNAIVQGCMIILNCHFCDCVTFSCRHRCYMIWSRCPYQWPL